MPRLALKFCKSVESSSVYQLLPVHTSLSQSQLTITEVDIRNPHSQITLNVVEDDGTVAEWFVEWADKNALIRRLVNVDRLRVGDEVTITGLPNRRLSNVAYFRQAVMPDGSILTDCGFRAFRESLENNTQFTCDPPE